MLTATCLFRRLTLSTDAVSGSRAFHTFTASTQSLAQSRTRPQPRTYLQSQAAKQSPTATHQKRHQQSSSSTRWKARQARDAFSREAKVAGLKSRAAFKLLQLNEKHRLFRKGMTVVDLGFAPGSWSQVAFNRCSPGARVIGIDILPAQPPRGVSTIMGDFLSPHVQEQVRQYIREPDKGRARVALESSELPSYLDSASALPPEAEEQLLESEESPESEEPEGTSAPREREEEKQSKKQKDHALGRVVDVVLSDMCEPWDQITGIHSRSVTNQYHRLMNTSGVPFRDHAGSMEAAKAASVSRGEGLTDSKDLCNAALSFAFDTLKADGHFVCKFYQGAEDKLLETKLRRLFAKVHREKPDASRKVS